MEKIIPYLIAVLVVLMVLVRMMAIRKKGAAAIRYEIIYLAIYGFIGGLLLAFLLLHPEMGLYAMFIYITYAGGFALRLIPLFRLITRVEREFEQKSS